MTKLTLLNPPPLASATDQVFDALYEAIISLDLPPGEKVSEADVARRLGVSRQPVRDAFFRLSKLGFLLIRPQRATLVTKISEPAVMKATFIRVALEVACFQAAAPRMGGAELDVLRGVLDAQQSAASRDARAEFHILDDAFHERICEFAGQGHVWALIREQKAHMDRVRFLSLSQDGQLAHDEHVAILEALEQGEIAMAEELLRRHIWRVREVLARCRGEQRRYFEDEA